MSSTLTEVSRARPVGEVIRVRDGRVVSRGKLPQNVFMDRFAVEPKVQRVWDKSHATWFTLMAIGGGLFILSRLLGIEEQLGHLLGMPVSDLISFVLIAIGGLVLIWDLGRPLRILRALLNPASSWISRGAIADFAFLIFGLVLVLPDLQLGNTHPLASLPWNSQAATAGGRVFEVVAMISALVVMFYVGAVLGKPRSIPYWHSIAIPVQFVSSGGAMAMGMIVLLEVANGRSVGWRELVVLMVMLAVEFVALIWHLLTSTNVPGKRESLNMLLRGRYRVLFPVGVIGCGTLVPLLLCIVGLSARGSRPAVAVVDFVLVTCAGFALRLVTLRVGVFAPVRGEAR
jgi:formate-dependent nitrite reductase membrane component NrfD